METFSYLVKTIERKTLAEIKSIKNGKTALRKAARNRYMASGKKKCCWICDHPEFDVSHIQAIETYSGTRCGYEVNLIENLAALCKICHAEFDNPTLPRSRLKKLWSPKGVCYLVRPDNRKVVLCGNFNMTIHGYPTGTDPLDSPFTEGKWSSNGSCFYSVGDVVDELE